MRGDARGCSGMHGDARGCMGMHGDAWGCTGMQFSRCLSVKAAANFAN